MGSSKIGVIVPGAPVELKAGRAPGGMLHWPRTKRESPRITGFGVGVKTRLVQFGLRTASITGTDGIVCVNSDVRATTVPAVMATTRVSTQLSKYVIELACLGEERYFLLQINTPQLRAEKSCSDTGNRWRRSKSSAPAWWASSASAMGPGIYG